MEKKKNWFNLVKKIFGSEKKKITEKKPPKEKKWRRPWFFSKARLHCPPAIKAPSPPLTKTLSEVESEQNKHALAVAVATAAAAEAAVAAAQAAAEIVRLTGNARLSRGSNEIGLRAAIKIQAVFRGFLARKALRALKGLVRLQALVRGWVVRKQATATLKSMQSLIKIQSQICATRVRKAEEIRMCEQINQLEENCRRKWDSSVLSKEELKAMFLSRQEASIKRDRALQYTSSHRERRNAERSSSSTLTESEQDKLNWRWSWLENWMDSQNIHGQNQIAEDSLDSKHTDEVLKTQLRSKEFKKSEQIAGSRSPISLPRKSFHQFRGSLIRDDESFSSSPTVPNYMASTESAKAKERSISTPKQRPGTIDTYSCHNSSPSKNRFPSFPSVNSDESINKLSKSIGYQPRSPLLKGLSGPIKSQRTPTKDLSLDSECSFFTRDQSTALG